MRILSTVFTLLFFSFNLSFAQNCNISNLYAEVIPGCEEGLFGIDIEFDVENGNNSGFDLFVNGEFYKYFSEYPDPFLRIEDFWSGNGSEIFIHVQDNDNAVCSDYFIFDSPECPGSCSLRDVTFTVEECDLFHGTYSGYLDFNHNYSDRSEFQISINGQFYGNFWSNIQLPLYFAGIVPRTNSAYDIVRVSANNSETCWEAFEYENPDCSTDECIIGELQLEERSECDENANYLIYPFFEYINTSDSFLIYIDDVYFNTFAYNQNDLIEVSGFIGDGTSYEMTVVDQMNPECQSEGIVGPVNCVDGEECEVGLRTMEVACNDDGSYNLHVYFHHENSSGFVDISCIGTEPILNHPVDQQPAIFGPFEETENGGVSFTLSINDSSDPACTQGVDIDYLVTNCGECNIDDIKIGAECLDDGTYNLKVFYDYSNTLNGMVTIRGNGNNYGEFDVNEQPVTLGPFTSDQTINEIVVIGNEVDDCFSFIEFEPIDCGITSACEIEIVEVELYCDGTDYYIDLLYNANDLFSELHFFVNEQLLLESSQEGDEIFVSLGPLSEAVDGTYELYIYDAELEDCEEIRILPAIPCEPVPCEIGEIFTEQECLDDGSYVVYLSFESAGLDLVNVRGNGMNYGDFEVPGVIELGPFGPNEVVNEFVVLNAINPDLCAQDVGFEAEPCNVGDCGVFDLVAEPYDCDPSTGAYSLDISFEYIDPGSDFFRVYINNEFLGSFPYADGTALTFNNIVPRANTDYDILRICGNESADCCEEIEYLSPNCDQEPCEIGEISVEQDCLDDGTYFVYLSFESAGLDLVNVRGNGMNYGDFEVPGIIELGPFGPNDVVNEFVVFNAVNPELCAQDVGFEAVPCEGEECALFDLLVEAYDCDPSTGTYSIEINFDYSNPGNDFFEVWINNEYKDVFRFDEGTNLIFTNISPRSNSDFDIIRICVNDVDDCCTVVEYIAPDCLETGCDIFNSRVEVECLADGTFFTYITFDHQETSGQVDIRGNGNAYGEFDVNELPIKLGPFEANTGLAYEFVIFDVEMEDCRDVIELGEVECEDENDGDCNLSELSVGEFDCDEDAGTYSALVNFVFENPNNDFFDVWVNNEFYAFLPFSDNPPFTITGISPRENSDYDIIRICVNDNEDCCVVLEYMQPDCINVTDPNAPGVRNIEVETLDCNEEATTYSILLDFETINFTGTEFHLWVNDFSMGPIQMASLPLIYSGIAPRAGTSQDIVRICLDDEEEYCEIHEYDQPDCLMVNTNELEAFEDISIFPNPSSDLLNIRGLNDKISEIRIVDQLGNTVSIHQGLMDKIELNSFNNGVYFIQFVDEDNYIYTQKFIKID